LKQTMRNKAFRSKTKTAMRRVMEAVNAGDAVVAKTALVHATKTIDKAASKGIYHKKNAARKKSKLAKIVNGISA